MLIEMSQLLTNLGTLYIILLYNTLITLFYTIMITLYLVGYRELRIYITNT